MNILFCRPILAEQFCFALFLLLTNLIFFPYYFLSLSFSFSLFSSSRQLIISLRFYIVHFVTTLRR